MQTRANQPSNIMKNSQKIYRDTSAPTLSMYKVSLPNSFYIKSNKKDKILANLKD